jgi:Trk-type K+ transport system membrane component
VFEEQMRPVNTVWYDIVRLSISYTVDVLLRFSAYQVVSAYTNTGASLVDTSMVPFQTAYTMVIVVCFLVLAGNTSFVGVCP